MDGHSDPRAPCACGGQPRPVGRRRGRALALLFVCALAALGAACGGPRTERYDDNAHGVSITYDAERFGPGTLAASGRIVAAEEAIGAEPLAAVEITASAPGAQATGLRVAVFEGPGEAGSLGFWRTTGQVLDSSLPKARAAAAPGVTIGATRRVTVAGLQGYAAPFTLQEPLEPGAGVGMALWRDPYVYEVIVLCRDADRRLLDGLTAMLGDLRLGTGLPVAAP
jgi:hypothetical protein